MKDSDFTYGCRSGIQKAIRRGNLDLAKTCFDALWADKEHQNWLKWRAPILVAEEAWYFGGMLHELVTSDHVDEEKDWRRFIYKLTTAVKNKDACGLYDVSAMLRSEEPPEALNGLDSQEVEAMVFWMDEADGNPNGIADEACEACEVGRADISDYEKGALNVFRRRMKSGGMFVDRWLCLAAMVLVVSRGIEKEAVEKAAADGVSHWAAEAGGRKPRTVNLPWYVFDMHTAPGKMALAIFMKNHAKRVRIESKEDFEELWFVRESGFVPNSMVRTAENEDKATFLDTVWVRLAEREKEKLRFGGRSTADRLWKRSYPEISSIVRWCLEKREER